MLCERRLIDANSLIVEAIKEKRFVFQKKDFLNEQHIVDTVYKDLGEFIMSAHTVDAVEVVHGRWEKKAAYNDGVLNTVSCSACKTFQPVGCWDYYPYCPYCGAKMDLE